ncbi:MAG: hypothetical protein ACC742_12655 [Thermoanaerobaculales bacterium]
MSEFHYPLNSNTLGRFLRDVAEGGYQRLDLRRFDFIDVYSSMVLALLLRYSCTLKGPPDLLLPESEDVRAYLARQELFQIIDEWYEIDDGLRALQARQWAGNPRVAPITTIESEGAVSQVVDRLRNLLVTPEFGVARRIADDVWRVLSETLQNIPQHASLDPSETETGFATLQLYRNRLDLAVGDAGIGIRRSLSENPRYRECSDTQSQLAVLQRGATKTARAGRGNGLQRTAEIIAALGGFLRLQSGDCVTVSSKGNFRQFDCTVFPGTQLLVRIPCRS